MIESALGFVREGISTGASTRNWAGIRGGGRAIARRAGVAAKLLTDPQTSGGLLVSCSAEAVRAVLEVFHNEGFEGAAVIGEFIDGPAGLEVV